MFNLVSQDFLNNRAVVTILRMKIGIDQSNQFQRIKIFKVAFYIFQTKYPGYSLNCWIVENLTENFSNEGNDPKSTLLNFQF